jgi:hypothetical protein
MAGTTQLPPNFDRESLSLLPFLLPFTLTLTLHCSSLTSTDFNKDDYPCDASNNVIKKDAAGNDISSLTKEDCESPPSCYVSVE